MTEEMAREVAVLTALHDLQIVDNNPENYGNALGKRMRTPIYPDRGILFLVRNNEYVYITCSDNCTELSKELHGLHEFDGFIVIEEWHASDEELWSMAACRVLQDKPLHNRLMATVPGYEESTDMGRAIKRVCERCMAHIEENNLIEELLLK